MLHCNCYKNVKPQTRRWRSEKRYLDEGHSHGVFLDVVFNGVAHPQNELVRDHKYQDVSSCHRLNQVWNGQLMERDQNTVRHVDHTAASNRQNIQCTALTTLGGSL